jgi:hypothetical protein
VTPAAVERHGVVTPAAVERHGVVTPAAPVARAHTQAS